MEEPALFTLREVEGQPDSWQSVLETVEEHRPDVLRLWHDTNPDEIVLTGCGSSYYVALSAAFIMESLTGIRCRALPASEILIYSSYLFGNDAGSKRLLIAISRSGETSETVKAAEVFNEGALGPVISLSCHSNNQMKETANLMISLASAQEHSVVMTKSFTSLLIALQVVTGLWAQDSAYLDKLVRIPSLGRASLQQAKALAQKVVAARQYDDYVFLGAGPRFGLASEAMLKVKEMALKHAEVYHPLEFRHGPKSIATHDTLVTLLQGGMGRELERNLARDLKGLGVSLLVIGDRLDKEIIQLSDFHLNAKFTETELADLALYMPTIQYMALYTALREGTNPDQPRNLTQVVRL